MLYLSTAKAVGKSTSPNPGGVSALNGAWPKLDTIVFATVQQAPPWHHQIRLDKIIGIVAFRARTLAGGNIKLSDGTKKAHHPDACIEAQAAACACMQHAWPGPPMPAPK